MIATDKLYYKDSFLTECDAEVTKILDDKIFIDRTVAFPEGGGQISDIGWLIIEDKKIPFIDVQKSMGMLQHFADFPSIKTDTMIYHVVENQYTELFEVGSKVRVIIDIERRIRTTVLHSALHLALKFAMEKRSGLYNAIKGCKISTDNGRLDFSISRFTPEEIEYINQRLDTELPLGKPIIVYPHKESDEAWYWKYEDFVCACGGTHVTNTNQIGKAFAKRKAIGKGTERLIVTVLDATLSKDNYHAY